MQLYVTEWPDGVYEQVSNLNTWLLDWAGIAEAL
jgi:hypothetical protein